MDTTAQARFEELKAKGLKNLKGADRKEYLLLLPQFKGTTKKVDHIVTAQDLQDTPELVDQGIKVGQTIQIDEEIAEPAKEISKPITVAKTDGSAPYIMLRNVRHDDVDYLKDSSVNPPEKVAKHFLESGFMRTKTYA